MSVRQTIETVLTEQFEPGHLDVIDESERHRGHAGWREGGETHFRVRIAARHFDGKSRVAQHREIMDALAPQFADRLHALSIEVLPSSTAG